MLNTMKNILILKKALLSASILMLLLLTACAEDVEVRVNAPEYVSDTFEVTIDIENVVDLDSGQFDLIFDPEVVNVIEVKPGNIDNTEVPVDMKRSMEDDRIRILINLPGEDAVSGSGNLTKIIFEITGDTGDTCELDLSYESDTFERGIFDIKLSPITASWFNDNVIIGTNNLDAKPTSDAPTTQIKPDGSASNSTSISSITQESAIKDKSDTTVQSGISQKEEQNKKKDLKTLTSKDFISVYSILGLLAFICVFALLKQ